MAKPTPPPLVLVEWEDARVLDSGVWAERTDHNEYEPQVFYQVGFLLLDSPERVVLTQAWSPDIMAARDQIPRGMVRSITPLQPVPAKKRGR